VFEVDGVFDGARTMTNAAIVIDGGEVVWVGPRNEIPKTPAGERTRAVSERHREGVRMAHKAGVRIATGTDAGAPFTRHDRFAMEPALLTECGLSAEEALIAATSRAADVMGLDKAGHIGAGCWADLLFVEGDPLKDLGVLRAPKGVYARGVAAL
jgi:imidazolonepropionase-like amidohydrolase